MRAGGTKHSQRGTDTRAQGTGAVGLKQGNHEALRRDHAKAAGLARTHDVHRPRRCPLLLDVALVDFES